MLNHHTQNPLFWSKPVEADFGIPIPHSSGMKPKNHCMITFISIAPWLSSLGWFQSGTSKA